MSTLADYYNHREKVDDDNIEAKQRPPPPILCEKGWCKKEDDK